MFENKGMAFSTTGSAAAAYDSGALFYSCLMSCLAVHPENGVRFISKTIYHYCNFVKLFSAICRVDIAEPVLLLMLDMLPWRAMC
jgi:hypothetical protein